MGDLELEQLINTQVKHIHPSKMVEVLEFIKNDPVLYGKAVSGLKYPIRTAVFKFLKLDELGAGSSTGKREFWIYRGWSEEDTAIKRKERYSKQDYAATSPYSRTAKQYEGMSEDEITRAIKSKRPSNVEYWIAKGFDEAEAKQKLVEFQQRASLKSKENNEGNSSRTRTQLGYWIKRGLSEDEARKKLSQSQDTKSIKSCVKRLGVVKGALTNLRHCTDVNTLASSIKRSAVVFALADYRKNRHWTPEQFLTHLDLVHKALRKSSKGQASTESLLFLGPVYEHLRTKYKCYIGAFGNKEFSLKYKDSDEKYRVVRYDFAVEELKIILEYDGVFYHDENTKSNDKFKEDLANKHGYRVVRLPGIPLVGDIAGARQKVCDIICHTFGADASEITWTFKRNFYYDKKDWKRCRANISTIIRN